ncbi:MAG: ABC transporter permease [Clostridiales bacterium]|jgi:putative ABC transport system permease protein|nr:ABC transporter permease [Clostridiales bacterium]
MSAYLKTVYRLFRQNLGRFVVILAIVAVGIGFINGVGAIAPSLRDGLSGGFYAANVPDLRVKSRSPAGFTPAELRTLADCAQTAEDGLLAFSAVDGTVETGAARFYFMPLSDMAVNRIALLPGGAYPARADEVLVERGSRYLRRHAVGDTVEWLGRTLTVTGVAADPLYFNRMPETATGADGTSGEKLNAVFYFDSAYAAFPVVTDVYLVLAGGRAHGLFGEAYRRFVEDAIAEYEALFAASGGDAPVFLSHFSHEGFMTYKAHADKLELIGLIFPAFFIVVVALVVLNTMTRFAEKERASIACCRTLGVGGGRIAVKYLLFAFLACALGSLIGILAGTYTIMPLVYEIFDVNFFMFARTRSFYGGMGLAAAGIMLFAVILVTGLVVRRYVRARPAALLRPPAPKPGGKVFLERIPFLWKRLSFTYKSTFRNIFRNLKHFFMTVISVMGSAALVFMGFALSDAANSGSLSSLGGSFESMISLVAFIVIVCAMLVSVLVIYNLTNINIEERRREIATLMVLGYKNGEVSRYIYREVLIMAVFGILLGLPLGFLGIGGIFGFLEFGALSDVRWYTWPVTAALSLLFVFFTDLLLYRKIVKTDMNASLKTVE